MPITKKAYIKPIGFCLTTVLFSISAVFTFAEGKIALVLDDIGNQYQSGLLAIDIPWVTTVAIMPGRPYTVELAEFAHQLGKEIIIHAPMSNTIDFPLGPMGLDRKMGKRKLLSNLQASIDNVPFAVGLSNHMGSRLTVDAEAMRWVMSALKNHSMYFFDSRTIAASIAWKAAAQQQVPWSKRDIFLDHYTDQTFMSGQWQKAVNRAKAGGNVTVICHPYPETIAFLKSLPLSSNDTWRLVALSELLNYPERIARDKKNIPKGS